MYRPHSEKSTPDQGPKVDTIGAFIIRIGFGGPLYYSYIKDPQNSIGND